MQNSNHALFIKAGTESMIKISDMFGDGVLGASKNFSKNTNLF